MEKMVERLLPDRHVTLRFGNCYSECIFHTRILIIIIEKGRVPILGNAGFT
jgi:hypothetical protein